MSTVNAQEMFKSILRDEIAPMLREHGWKGSGKDYKRTSELYRAFINFQKNRYNTKDEVEFTVNLGVLNDESVAECQAAWQRAREQWGQDVIVIPTWGQWIMRIGHLLPTEQDKWWRLLTGRSPETTVAEVLKALSEFALPAIERQMDKSRVEPSYVIETRGRPSGRHFLPNGDIREHNVGGERIYPIDALHDAVDHEWVLPEKQTTPTPEIPVDFRVTHPDGCISLEGDLSRRHTGTDGVQLKDGMRVVLFQWWIDPKGHKFINELSGDARYNEAWGWGAEVSPKSLWATVEALDRIQARPLDDDRYMPFPTGFQPDRKDQVK